VEKDSTGAGDTTEEDGNRELERYCFIGANNGAKLRVGGADEVDTWEMLQLEN